MYRSAVRLPRRAILTAAVAGTGLVLADPKDKPSIYPSSTPDILLVDEPTELERQIGVVRRQACAAVSQTRSEVQSWVSKWISVEHAIENRVKAIISPNESLTPGILYVGVATLTGSIVGRNRFILTRLLLPPAFLVLSAQHFLPETTKNLSDYLGSIEDKYFPAFSHTHEIAKAHSSMTWERAKEATKESRQTLNQGALTAVGKIQEVTGLKLRETLGLDKPAPESKVSQAVKEHAAAQPKPEVVVEQVELVDKKAEPVDQKEADEPKEEKKRLV